MIVKLLVPRTTGESDVGANERRHANWNRAISTQEQLQVSVKKKLRFP